MTATVEQDATEHQNAIEHHRIAIVGSGFAGLGMAVKLKQAGIEDFVVLERTGDVGGTWHLNTYPGCQCDIPSHLYSFSFAPNPDWSRTYSLATRDLGVPAPRLARAAHRPAHPAQPRGHRRHLGRAGRALADRDERGRPHR